SLTLGGGSLTGTGTLNVNNVMTWSAGAMSGSGRTVIAPGAILTITNNAVLTLTGRTLENGGTVLWTGTTKIDVGSGVVTNRAGALWEVRGDLYFVNLGGPTERFDNVGTFRKATGAGAGGF